MASEYHGTVKAGGLALPGATVTASQGDKQIVTTTDQQGAFSFSELADGTWTIEVEMLGFEKMSRQVGVASDAPAADFALKFLTEEALGAAQEVRKPATRRDRNGSAPKARSPPKRLPTSRRVPPIRSSCKAA